jgi:hypothetical protein
LYKVGASKSELAAQLKIGMGSLKKLLQERGVKKKSRYGLRRNQPGHSHDIEADPRYTPA